MQDVHHADAQRLYRAANKGHWPMPCPIPMAFYRDASQAELEKRAARVRKRTADSVAGGLINRRGERLVCRAAWVCFEDSRWL